MKIINTRKIKANKKFKVNNNYSGFWMSDRNDYYNNLNQFSGLNANSNSTSDMVKAVKLASYRKAISNFVKIVTKQDIPVIFKGTESYTDFNSIVLSTDIKDNNFDVSVGLALHEASHIVHTDPKYLKNIFNTYNPDLTSISPIIGSDAELASAWKSLLNWIEDRRIDQIVFKSSPGYKAYYHKMYDYYWNDPKIDKALHAKNAFTDPTKFESYEFRIINSLNPNTRKDALPGLREILDMIDVRNITRLKSVQECGELAARIIEKIVMQLHSNNQQQQQDLQERIAKSQSGKPSDEQQDAEQQEQTDGDGNGEGSGDNDQQQETADGPDMSASDLQGLKSLIRDQKAFMNNEVKKASGTKAMGNRLAALKKLDVEVQQVGGAGGVDTMNALIYNLTKNTTVTEYAELAKKRRAARIKGDGSSFTNEDTRRMDSLQDLLPDSLVGANCGPDDLWRNGQNLGDPIQLGLDLGAVLGRKLNIRNEVRELVHNRTRTGSIDKKRLAEAGYGIESIFKQIHIDKYKKGMIYISLDGSGSMNGSKWANTVMMTMAIAKAVNYVQNLDVQVDIRTTERNGRMEAPVVGIIYDSRINKIQHLAMIMSISRCSGMTPEGLCTEAMIKRNHYKKSDSSMDSFYLNICDGEPGGIGSSSTQKLVEHTRAQVMKLRNELNMNVLGYFISDSARAKAAVQVDSLEQADQYGSSFRKFYMMYGRGSKYAPANNMQEIAKDLNKLLLSSSYMV